MSQSILIDTITINVVTNFTNNIAVYTLEEQIYRVHDQYRYFTISNPNFINAGVAIKVRKRMTSTILDFNVVNINSFSKIHDSNKKYFVKGEYDAINGKFKRINTGGEFNDKLLINSFDTLLVKNILELIKYASNS